MVDKGDFKKDIVIKFRIHPGYNIYAYVADSDPYTVTDIKIDVPEGYKKSGELHKPSFRFYKDSGTTIYTDEVMFIQEIKGKGIGEAKCTISYQCCDRHICFLPVVDKQLTVELK